MSRVLRPLALILLLAATAMAQEPWFRGYGYGYNRVPPRFPKADSYDGGLGSDHVSTGGGKDTCVSIESITGTCKRG